MIELPSPHYWQHKLVDEYADMLLSVSARDELCSDCGRTIPAGVEYVTRDYWEHFPNHVDDAPLSCAKCAREAELIVPLDSPARRA